MTDDIEEIKKLTPEERIKRLKKLEEDRKKEIREAQDLLKSSENEFEQEERIKQDMPIPQMKAVDIDHLFSPDEKQMFRAKHGADIKGLKEVVSEEPTEAPVLEETVAAAQPEVPEEALKQANYLQTLALTPFEQLQQEAQDMYQEFKDQGYATQEQQDRAGQLYQAMQMKDEAARRGDYDATKQMTDQIDPTKRMLHTLGQWYEVR